RPNPQHEGCWLSWKSSRLLTDTTGVRVLHIPERSRGIGSREERSVPNRRVEVRVLHALLLHRGRQIGKAAGMRGRCLRVRLPSSVSPRLGTRFGASAGEISGEISAICMVCTI